MLVKFGIYFVSILRVVVIQNVFLSIINRVPRVTYIKTVDTLDILTLVIEHLLYENFQASIPQQLTSARIRGILKRWERD